MPRPHGVQFLVCLYEDMGILRYLAALQRRWVMKWTEEQAEEAYLYWASEGKQSYKSTGDYTGIPERTVYYIAKRDAWAKRRSAELEEAAGPAVRTFRAEV